MAFAVVDGDDDLNARLPNPFDQTRKKTARQHCGQRDQQQRYDAARIDVVNECTIYDIANSAYR